MNNGVEIILVSSTQGLAEVLNTYEGLRVGTGPIDVARRLVMSEQPPKVVFVEDTASGSIDELFTFAQVALSRQVKVLIGLQSMGLSRATDFHDAGLPFTDSRGADEIAAWIGAQLGVRKRAAGQQIMITVGGAKGGIGKTLVVSMLAEGLKRRGLRVLVVDGDISNSGIMPGFRIPSGSPSYLQIAENGSNAWTPTNVQRYVHHHKPSGIDFLLGSEETADMADLTLHQWQALVKAVRAMEGYDVILFDTGPEIKKRPYAVITAREGGHVVLPCPPGRKERQGTGNALHVFETGIPNQDLTDRCLLLFMEPERGQTVTVDMIAPAFARRFPRVRTIGRLPRDPALLSAADEPEHYVCPLDLKPHGPFATGVHLAVENLCRQVGLRPPLPMPKSTLVQRWLNRTPPLPVASGDTAYGGAV